MAEMVTHVRSFSDAFFAGFKAIWRISCVVKAIVCLVESVPWHQASWHNALLGHRSNVASTELTAKVR